MDTVNPPGQQATGTLSKITTPGVEKAVTKASKMRRNACVRDCEQRGGGVVCNAYKGSSLSLQMGKWVADAASSKQFETEVLADWQFEEARLH